jgi:flagellar hook assembly protein FlgD
VGYARTVIRKETSNSYLCYTEDGGTNWRILETPAEFKPICVSSNGKYIFSGGLDGKILTNKSTTVGIQNETDFDLSFELYENYPNPFNLSTTITFQLKQPSFINLEIYNVLGKKIKTLLNEYIYRGFHKIIWDGRDGHNNTVSSGIYIIKISNNINSKINKSVLIK